MVTFAVIEFGLLFLALILSYVHVSWIKKRRARITVSDEIKGMFNHEWNGTDEDELYAWYRVRFKVMQLADTKRRRAKKLEEIEQCIRRLNSNLMRGRASVSHDGKLQNAAHLNEFGLF